MWVYWPTVLGQKDSNQNVQGTAWTCCIHGAYIEVLLMEEILHHLRCIKPCKYWDKLLTGAGFLPSTGSLTSKHDILNAKVRDRTGYVPSLKLRASPSRNERSPPTINIQGLHVFSGVYIQSPSLSLRNLLSQTQRRSRLNFLSGSIFIYLFKKHVSLHHLSST